MKQYVQDLKSGVEVDSLFAVLEKKVVPFRDPTRGSFLSVMLGDRTGQVEARAWEDGEEFARRIAINTIVRVTGSVEEFRGLTQVRITGVEAADPDEADPADFLGQTHKDIDQLRRSLEETVCSVRTPHIAALLTDWFADPGFLADYLNSPAAKYIHHSYLGGLVEHSLEVWQILDRVIAIHPELDRDLLVAGALLHDVGKIRDYRSGVTIELTDEGRLLGHTILGYEMLMERIRRLQGFPAETAAHLGHLILSHHGHLEYGAPVLPQTVEACALHHADLLSGRVKQFMQVIERHRGSEEAWTPHDRWLGGQVYLGYGRGLEIRADAGANSLKE